MDEITRKRLEKEFPGRKITVYNIGIEGSDLQREISFAEFEGERLELDMAVFYAGGNDINYSFERGNADYQPFTEDDRLYQNLIENLASDKK
ncbi:SGNH/GDSL hydrolase family protein, partial [bacterium]|nr:SGNH/GDSL hydrolase family protein [bacterium]